MQLPANTVGKFWVLATHTGYPQGVAETSGMSHRIKDLSFSLSLNDQFYPENKFHFPIKSISTDVYFLTQMNFYYLS